MCRVVRCARYVGRSHHRKQHKQRAMQQVFPCHPLARHPTCPELDWLTHPIQRLPIHHLRACTNRRDLQHSAIPNMCAGLCITAAVWQCQALEDSSEVVQALPHMASQTAAWFSLLCRPSTQVGARSGVQRPLLQERSLVYIHYPNQQQAR